MKNKNAPLITVIGATGNQGGSVVRALQSGGKFRVRALTRNPGKHGGIADEVVAADLNRPETLESAFEGAYGVFAVTNFWEGGGADEVAQGEAAVRAAREAGVEHFVWSTLPNVEAITGGKFNVPHFTNKAKVDAIVSAAGFRYHSFVIAPFFYQNLQGVMAPQQQQDGSMGWTLPIDPAARVIHAGDINELGKIVAGALANPDAAGGGQHLPLVGDLLSFDDIVATLNKQGHAYTFNQVPREIFATLFPGRECRDVGYFAESRICWKFEDVSAGYNLAGATPNDFATWARSNLTVGKDKALAERG